MSRSIIHVSETYFSKARSQTCDCICFTLSLKLQDSAIILSKDMQLVYYKHHLLAFVPIMLPALIRFSRAGHQSLLKFLLSWTAEMFLIVVIIVLEHMGQKNLTFFAKLCSEVFTKNSLLSIGGISNRRYSIAIHEDEIEINVQIYESFVVFLFNLDKSEEHCNCKLKFDLGWQSIVKHKSKFNLKLIQSSIHVTPATPS